MTLYNAPAFSEGDEILIPGDFGVLKKMTENLSLTEVKKKVFLIPVWQLISGIMVSIIFYLVSGQKYAIAGFYGALVSVSASLAFALVIFSGDNKSTDKITKKIFRAEAIKMLVAGLMFYLAFAKLALPFMPVVVGFLATLIVFFVALLTVFR